MVTGPVWDPGIVGFLVIIYFLMKLNYKDPKGKDFLDLMFIVPLFFILVMIKLS